MFFLEWTIIIFLFALSLIGVILPLIPDTLPLWVGFLLYRFTLAETGFPFVFWLGMIFISILIIGSDIFTNIYFVKRYGGSKWSILGAILGALAGTIILGPFGLILGPLLVVFLITFIESEETNKAFKTAVGTILAFFSSTVIKIVLQLIMIIWFFVSI